MQNRLIADLGKAITVLVLLTILLMPIFVGKMNFPWWRVDYKDKNGVVTKTVDFCLIGNTSGMNVSLFKIYAKDEIIDYDDAKLEKTNSAFNFIHTMLLIGAVLTIISMVCIIITSKKKMPIKITMLVSLVTFIFLLIAPIYFILKVPSAYNEDLSENYDMKNDIKFFIGASQKKENQGNNSTSYSNEKIDQATPATWFPIIGCFLALTPPIINIHAVLGMYKNKRSYTYIPRKRADLLYQQNQNHAPRELVIQPKPNIPPPIAQQPKPSSPGLVEFKAIVEEDVDERRIQEIHEERLKLLKELKAEADLEEMLDEYNSTISKIEEEEEEKESKIKVPTLDVSELLNMEKEKNNHCPKCGSKLKISNSIIKCEKCGAKFRRKKG